MVVKQQPKAPPNRRKLTDRFVERETVEKRTLYWDTGRGGVGLMVSPPSTKNPKGTKSWKIAYRHGGRLKWLHIGRYPALPLKEARDAAVKHRARVALGEDPHGDRIASRRGEVLRDIAERYVEEYAKKNNKSWAQGENLRRRHVLPVLGSRKIKDIQRSDMRRIFDRLTADGSPILANQVLAAAGAVFAWAMEKDIVDTNPARGIKRNKTKARDRYLLEDEVRTLWPALDDHGLLRSHALKLVLLTSQRPGEVRHLRREHIDGRWWSMPGAPDEKLGWPGTKNGLDHRAYFSDAAMDLLKEIGLEGDGFVFPGQGGRAITGLDRVMRAITKDLQLRQAATPHALRATASTYLSRLRIPKDTISKILNHKEGGITDSYIRHSFDDEKAAAMETLARWLDETLTGEPAKVVKLPVAG